MPGSNFAGPDVALHKGKYYDTGSITGVWRRDSREAAGRESHGAPRETLSYKVLMAPEKAEMERQPPYVTAYSARASEQLTGGPEWCGCSASDAGATQPN